MKPTKSILDSTRPYTCSAKTDLRKTFAAWHRQYTKAWDDAHAENIARNLSEAQAVVRPIKKGRA